MAKICYQSKEFGPERTAKINSANSIIEEYKAKGYELTLRQIYYQFVSRNLIRNNEREYKNLGSILNEARLAGLVDWDAIVDRTRNLQSQFHCKEPTDIIETASRIYYLDKWVDQKVRPEVWIEKDALVGIIQGVCDANDIAYFSCRGYTSQSELWEAGQRMLRYVRKGQTPMVLHFGDHDPSGIDMTRDITERLEMFVGQPVEVKRMALTIKQIEAYNPPPNPCKLTDSRANSYVERFGDESWELDALEPEVITKLVQDEIDRIRDYRKWNAALKQQKSERDQIAQLAKQDWEAIKEAFDIK